MKEKLMQQTLMLEQQLNAFLTGLNKANKNPAISSKEFEEMNFPHKLCRVATYAENLLITINLLDKPSDRLLMMSLATPLIQTIAGLGPLVHNLLASIKKIESLKEKIVESKMDKPLANAEKELSDIKATLFKK